MKTPTRRTFLHTSAVTGLSAVAYTRVAQAAATGARPVIAFIGCGGRCKGLVKGFQGEANVAWACDPDQQRAAQLQQLSKAGQVTGDLRHVLDDQRGKLTVWDDSNRQDPNPSPQEKPTLPRNHQVDFLEAITAGRKPAADIAIGHDSCSLVHLANICVRTGRSLTIDAKQQTIPNDAEASVLLGRTYRAGGHWSVPST